MIRRAIDDRMILRIRDAQPCETEKRAAKKGEEVSRTEPLAFTTQRIRVTGCTMYLFIVSRGTIDYPSIVFVSL